MEKRYLLALDIGTSSIGHAVFSIDGDNQPLHLVDIGVRIFPDGRDPKTKIPLAVQRRTARGLRRNRDRGQNRVRRLVAELKEFGLLPKDEAQRSRVFRDISPYEARRDAVQKTVSGQVLARALVHLGRRRGFRSNRSTGESKEETEFKGKIEALRDELGKRTLGEYLCDKYLANLEMARKGDPQSQKNLRFRAGETDFFPDRKMYLDEFEAIKQQQGNRWLTDEQWTALKETIFWQYPFKPVPKGKCRFFPQEARAHKDLPCSHQFRIYQEVNALRFESEGRECRLDERQRHGVCELLNRQATLTFKALAKKKDENNLPYFPPDAEFNLNVRSRSGKLEGNRVLVKLRKPEYMGEVADTISERKLNDIVVVYQFNFLCAFC